MPRISVVALIGTGVRGAGALRPGSGVDSASGAAHEEAALCARFDQPLRQQLVVGGDHRGRADLVPARAFAHRGQARAGREQALADALGKTRRELVGQGAVGLAATGAWQPGGAAASSMACAGLIDQYSE